MELWLRVTYIAVWDTYLIISQILPRKIRTCTHETSAEVAKGPSVANLSGAGQRARADVSYKGEIHNVMSIVMFIDLTAVHTKPRFDVSIRFAYTCICTNTANRNRRARIRRTLYCILPPNRTPDTMVLFLGTFVMKK